MKPKILIKQIRIYYNSYYYPEAEDYLIKHLKISVPKQYDDSLFLQNTDTANSNNSEQDISSSSKDITKKTQETQETQKTQDNNIFILLGAEKTPFQ